MTNRNIEGLTHDQLQAECWKRALRLYHPFLDQRLFCIPNDMYAGNVARWKQYEALGVTPGVWDMQLIWLGEIEEPRAVSSPGRLVQATHWFEFKVGNDELSNKQKQFRTRMLPLGHKFYIISETAHFEDALKLIVEPTLHIAKQIWKEEYEIGKSKKKE